MKVAYLRHLRELAIVENQLIPTVLFYINLQDDDCKMFRLDSWKLDEYHFECKYNFLLHFVMTMRPLLDFNPESSLSLKLLAAHLFYRALRSLWECPARGLVHPYPYVSSFPSRRVAVWSSSNEPGLERPRSPSSICLRVTTTIFLATISGHTAGTAHFLAARNDTESYVPVNLARNFLARF